MQQTQQTQEQKVFTLTDMTGHDIEAIMNGLNELPGKFSRATMNKIEAQIVQQVIGAQVPPPGGNKGDDDGEQKPE